MSGLASTHPIPVSLTLTCQISVILGFELTFPTLIQKRKTKKNKRGGQCLSIEFCDLHLMLISRSLTTFVNMPYGFYFSNNLSMECRTSTN